MIRTDTIHSLSEFRKNAAAHLKRLAETGGAEVLTVNGKAEGVLMSPETFDRLMEDVELARSIRLIQASEQAAKDGKVAPIQDAIQRVKDQLGNNSTQ